ncbi:unnamed protein product [Cylindrotheca closterium]|uniref:Uncharacterized protein n=1 Tax=Cylindrotheca closterium TaxID=2856 RepID=A0AAD2FTM0_9STRA|nr:unnamed protein product [Cylindrotheca closterium]
MTMDFEFDDSVDSSRASSRSSTLVSQRSHKRRRQQESDDDSSTVSSRRIAVKGAGKSASAVQDAGSFQMLRDECLDLCSTIISREDKGDGKSLNAAVDLALLLSNKKTRSILWQNDTLQDLGDIDSNCGDNSSVLMSILNAVASHTPKKSRGARNSTNPSRNRSRTKSARRKQKQQSQNDSVTSVGNQKVIPTSPQMKQVLACIFYFLSWDCTLSKDHSVAAMGTKTNPNIARKIRMSILQNGDALQGAVQLLFGKEALSTANSIPSLSVASSSMQTPKPNSQQRVVAISGICSPASNASTISSVSFQEEAQQLVPIESKRKLGDPTAAGRQKRRKRRLMQSIAEDETVSNPNEDMSSKKILPPPKLNCSSTDFSFSDERDTFATPKAPPKVSHRGPKSCDEHHTTTSGAATANPKLWKLLSKIKFTSKFIPDHLQQDKWLSMLFLQSLNRVIEGKDLEGPSCMENENDDDNNEASSDDESNEEFNPILLTNSLLYKSGVLPLLARAMSDSFQEVTRMLIEDDTFASTMDWDYRQEQMSVLASLIDGACLFCESNRRAFCEEDPFSFEERNQGLLCHIFLFLDQCAKRCCKTPNDKMDAVMLMGLRMLTSLTHDNEVAGEQLTSWSGQGATGDGSIRGLDTLANLVFVLEGSGDETKKESSLTSQEAYHHRYDCIVFCLNTLANIVEGSDVRRLLTEINVDAPSCRILWLEWLCRWLKIQTASFQDAIMDGGTNNGQSSSQERELQKAEEDRLVAAGNGCVLLACLMKEPESISEEPELTNTIRQLIVDQMPKSKDGGSTGVIMIVNTLKAFCNFYQLSLGDLSVAIVAPVKKLIQELQEMGL